MTALRAGKLAIGICLAVLLLAGCEPQGDKQSASRPAQSAPAAYQGAAGGPASGSEGRHLAISHQLSLQVPADKIQEVHQKHLAECRRLGCEVLSSSLDQSIKGHAQAHSAIRIAPQAFPAFEAVLFAPPAQVTLRTETAEDKTLPLLDIEKRLEVKTALRDRLTAMIRQPGQATITDLASIERQIADVQGDIEAATAQRDYLRTITDTVRVDIDYFGSSGTAGGVDFSPILDAFAGGLDTLIGSTASVIVFALVFLPWIPLVALTIWAIRRLRPRWKR
jgi:hypothetical protein